MKCAFKLNEETRHILWGIGIGIFMAVTIYFMFKFYEYPKLSDADEERFYHVRML